MIVYFGGPPPSPEEVWVRLRGFESPLVHLLGLVYDACCLPAFVVLRARTQARKSASSLLPFVLCPLKYTIEG